MSELLRRAAPGLALAGAALTAVWLFDPALSGGNDEGSTTASTQGTPEATTSSPSAEATGCANTTSATGDAMMTRWGPVQVTMELAPDGSVCGVHAIAYPQDDPHSARLNARAISIIDARAAQDGVAFDAVSGATYTSEAYRASMQSILDAR